jgi:hypothetical protein
MNTTLRFFFWGMPLLLTSCAGLSGSTRPNSYQEIQGQPRQVDP